MDAFVEVFTQNPVGFVVSFILAMVLLAAFIALTIRLVIVIVKKVQEGKIAEIPGLLLDYMSAAEKLVGASGETKKEVVMSRVRTYCAENKLKFDEAAVSNMIEAHIEYSKNVNAKERKDEEDNSQPFQNEEIE